MRVQAQEILLKRDRSLLGEFLEHMLDFQVRPSASDTHALTAALSCGFTATRS